MGRKDEDLDQLRADIDAIDAEIHGLLKRRAEAAARIGALKEAGGAPGLAIRPEREAQLVRRLVADHDGPLPVRVVVRIWREIIAAMINLQTPYRVDVFGGDRAMEFRDLARAYFGSYVEVRNRDSAMQVLSALQADNRVLGVLPMPESDDAQSWWLHLMSGDPGDARIIGRLPFVFRDGERSAGAYVLGRLERGESGEDITLLGVEVDGEVSRGRVAEWLTSAGLEARTVHAETGGGGASARHLIAVHAYLRDEDERLQAFMADHEGTIRSIRVLGGYATPLVLDARAQ